MIQVIKLVNIHLRSWMFDRKNYIAMVIQFIYLFSILHPIIELSNRLKLDIVFSLYVFLWTDPVFIIISSVSFLILISKLPFNNELQMYLIQKTSLFKWLVSQIIFLFVIILGYVTFLFCSFSLILISNLSFSFESWGKLIGTMNYYPDIINQFDIAIKVPSEVIINYTPLSSFCIVLSLTILVFMLSGLILFVLNIIKSGLGTNAYVLFIFLYLAVKHFDKFYGFYISIFSWMDISNVSTSNLDGYPTWQYVLCILFIGISACLFLIYRISLNLEIRKRLILWNS